MSVVCASGTATAAVETPAEKPETAKEPPATLPGLSDLIPKAAELNLELARLTRQLSQLPTGERIEPKLSALETRVNTLGEALEKLKSQERRHYERLIAFRRDIEAVNKDLNLLNEPLAEGLRKIDRWRSQWRTDLKFWQQWESRIEAEPVLPMVQSTFDSAMRAMESARERILRHMEPMMTAQKRAFELQVRINEMLMELESIITATRGEFLRDFSPPMYAPAYWAQFGSWLAYDLISGAGGLLIPMQGFLLRRGWVIGLQILLVLVITLGIYRSGQTLENIESLRFMRRHPQSVGWLIAAAVCWNLYEPMPTLWNLLLSAIILVTTARLVGGIVKTRRRAALVYLLSAVLLATRLLVGIELPSPLFRIYLVGVALGLGILCLRFLLRPSERSRPRLYTVILAGTAAACAVVAVIEISGYSALALYIFQSTLITLFIIVLARLMMLLFRGLLESVLRSRSAQKIPFLKAQTATLIDRIAKLLNLLVLLLLCGAALQTWRVFTSSWELIFRIATFGVTLGETRITVGLVLAAAACLYGALIASRFLQFFLMRDVFARRRVDPGIGMSITRLLHYAMILVGVMLALATLGFKLTNLTIIASALSVGIGFGLQTIVNNFVCGLILLFERPVKVGDIIQLGDQWATIRDIGLRATTIQTFDRSDIVVPNSDLITNQVTNWTLADRNMRLILTVGVAYGSDVPLVLQTLQETTRETPRILNDPAPLIFFMGFGDSSLDFQLRVWIDDIDYMNVVRSELNQAIDAKFRERGIEIPFPQRDLHLRSVAPPAAKVFSANSPTAADNETGKKTS
ncbi:MAG TPA: mechanosensitive ion channel domain-containing protein [Desulfobacterales bacterium]